MTAITPERAQEIRARLDAYPQPTGVGADDLDLSGDVPRVRCTLYYRSSDLLPATGSPYATFLTHAPTDLADLLAEREKLLAERDRLLAVVEAADRVMFDLVQYGSGIVGHLLDNDDNDGQRLRDALEALIAYRAATTGEATPSIVCMDPLNCKRTDHAAGAGGTLVHLPPDGKIVPGLFDHGVPSDATTGEAGQ